MEISAQYPSQKSRTNPRAKGLILLGELLSNQRGSMLFRNYICAKLKDKSGNAIITGVVATTILGITIVLVGNGYLSTLKFKARTEQKAALTPILDAVLTSVTKTEFFKETDGVPPNETITAPAFMTRLLGTDGLDVPGGGKLIQFDTNSAALLSEPNAIAKANLCKTASKAPLVPSSKNDPSTFIFCVSLKNTNLASPNTFFGSDAGFAVFKVVLRPVDSSQKDFLTSSTTWGTFVDDPDRQRNFQAEITYSIFWGKKNDSVNSFEKFGITIKDLG
ncbi:MAG: hypothetical protein EBR01_11680 [Proteobacteria bacterium]|nr:hypothetical protein [Pseudomonadota bacterium]